MEAYGNGCLLRLRASSLLTDLAESAGAGRTVEHADEGVFFAQSAVDEPNVEEIARAEQGVFG